MQPLSHIRTRRPLAAAAAACALGALIVGCGGSSNSGGESSKAAEPRATSGASSLTSTTEPKSGAPAPGTPVQGATVPVAYRNIAISPAKLRVKVGATVVWTNYDSVEHNVTSEGGPQKLASQNFGEGSSYSAKLLKPGVIHYRCTIHPASMNGTIEVVK